MPMFDLESADSVRLRDCATTSEAMLKVSGKVGEVDAGRCEAGVVFKAPADDKITRSKRFKNFCIANTSSLLISIFGGLVVLLVGAYYGLN